ncbi:MAG: hypothetical protein RIF32_12815 [Leptospirales bacterium]
MRVGRKGSSIRLLTDNPFKHFLQQILDVIRPYPSPEVNSQWLTVLRENPWLSKFIVTARDRAGVSSCNNYFYVVLTTVAA